VDDSPDTLNFLPPHLYAKLPRCFEIHSQPRFLKYNAIDLPRRIQRNDRVRHIFLNQCGISFQWITVAAAACNPHIKHIGFVKLKITVWKNLFLPPNAAIFVGGLLLAINSLTVVFSINTITLGAPG